MIRYLPALVLLAVCISEAAERKARYNMWVKERVRYLADRVRMDPYNAELRVLLGNAYYEDGHVYEAESHLERALEMRPGYAEAHCNLAVILHSESRLREAEKHYQAALNIDTTLVEALAGLGALWCRTDKQKKGMSHLELVLTIDPRRINARYNLAVAYHKVGDFEQAILHLQQVLEESPKYPEARRGLAQARFSRGLILLQAKQPNDALPYLVGAVKMVTDDADIHFARGIAHMRLEQYVEAERSFAKAVELEDDHVPALHNLGAIMERVGRTTEAEYYFSQVQIYTPHLHTIQAARQATYDEEYLMR